MDIRPSTLALNTYFASDFKGSWGFLVGSTYCPVLSQLFFLMSVDFEDHTMPDMMLKPVSGHAPNIVGKAERKKKYFSFKGPGVTVKGWEIGKI